MHWGPNRRAPWSRFGGSYGTPKLFLRFVWLGLNTSGSATTAVQVRALITIKPLKSRTFTIGPIRIPSSGSSGTWLVIPLIAPIPSEIVDAIRGTLELESTTGDLEVKAAYQKSNKPLDASDWDGDTDIAGTTRNSNGISYGGTFASVAVNEDFIRIVAKVRNVSGNDLEAARISVRIDIREP